MLVNRLVKLLFLIFLTSCSNTYQDPISIIYDGDKINNLINLNKSIYKIEEMKIDSFIQVLNLPFLKDKTGVRMYKSYNDLNEDIIIFPKDGDVVTVGYYCASLDEYIQGSIDSSRYNFFNNDQMWNYSINDTVSFQLGYSKQMSGLNYAIKLLKIGDKAKIIIPSYLGFGMSGYFDEVKPYETLVLNVELLNIE